MARGKNTHSKGNLIELAGNVEKWLIHLLKSRYPEVIPWAKKKSWKSPMARFLFAKALIGMKWVNEDDPKVQELFKPQMRGKRKKKHR